MAALANQHLPLECTISIVDTFSQNLKAMKAKKKATRVTSLKNSDPAGEDQAMRKTTKSLTGALQEGAKRERRKSGRRLQRKSGNSSTNLAALAKNGGPGLQRSNTDPSVSLAERISKLKKKTGCTVDPDEWLAERREAKRQQQAQASSTNNSLGGRRPTSRRGMPRKNSSSFIGNLAAAATPNPTGHQKGFGLQRASTAPTLSLQQRMEKLKVKQGTMPDPDEMLKRRRENKAKAKKLFGSAPNLPGMEVDSADREERRRRRSTSRGRKTRISRTTSAGRMHDEKELPVLASYSRGATLKRSCTDTGAYPDLVAKMQLQQEDPVAKSA